MVAETLEGELTIRNTSNAFFLDALRTLPLIPEYGNVVLSAYGMKMPWVNQTDDMPKYLSDCSERRIVPFSQLNWELEKGIMVPKRSKSMVSIGGNEPPEVIRAIIDGLRSGGKAQEHHFQIENFGKYSIFERLMNDDIVGLLTHGYQIKEGNLWLTTYYGGDCYSKGYSDKSSIRFGQNKGLRLDIGSEEEPEHESKMKDWFNRLALTHQPK